VHRLGLFRLAMFFTVDPLWDELFGTLHVHGCPPSRSTSCGPA
jgi:hypothetical protein